MFERKHILFKLHLHLCLQILEVFSFIAVTYRIYSHNLRIFFSSLAAEKSGCVKYADLFRII
jgi:hypothetical protein